MAKKLPKIEKFFDPSDIVMITFTHPNGTEGCMLPKTPVSSLDSQKPSAKGNKIKSATWNRN